MINTQNLIFLNQEDIKKSIYRIFSFSRLIEVIQNKQLTLVKPKLWDDPFENFILESQGITRRGEMFEIGFRDHFYGQCWSLTKESDAMWRIYSPTKEGVKVKTTIERLFQPFYDSNGSLRDISCFIGKVQYKGKKYLLDMLSNRDRMSGKIFDPSGWGQASSFFFKRTAFKHENEVRLIYNGRGQNNRDIYSFNINPLTMFDEIVFDPRMDKIKYGILKAEIMSLGFNKVILRSGLYELPNLIVHV